MTEENEKPILTILDSTHVLVQPAPKRKPGRPAKVAAPKPVETAPADIDILSVLDEVKVERWNQDATFGEQNHPLTGSNKPERKIQDYEAAARNWKAVNANRVGLGIVGWDGILLEEVYEALAESDPAKARAELVQVAAVAVAMIEYIDRSVQL